MVTWGSMKRQQEKPEAFATWTWYDWTILVALSGIGWGSLFALVELFR